MALPRRIVSTYSLASKCSLHVRKLDAGFTYLEFVPTNLRPNARFDKVGQRQVHVPVEQVGGRHQRCVVWRETEVLTVVQDIVIR